MTDGQQRKALSAARSLGRAGHRVAVAEVTRFATARFSKYVSLGLVCPDPSAQPDQFIAWLKDAVRRHEIDLVMPMDDHTTRLVVQAAAAGELGAAALVPEPEAFRIAADKGATVELAARAGVRTPRTSSVLKPEVLEGAWGWPVVVKGRHGSGARTIRRAESAAELRRLYREIDMLEPNPVIQEYIPPGRKYDVCLLYTADGEPTAAFVQEELRGYPLWGGPSTLQESVHRPDLVALALALLAPVGWRGPVEVEFLEDPRTGEPVLMEINPRYWASVDLAVACGIDFPRWAAELALGQSPAYPESYPAGRRCRWLLPGDLLHFIANPDRFRMNPPFLRLDPFTHDDILSREDPMPALGFCLAVLRYALDLRMWRLIIR